MKMTMTKWSRYHRISAMVRARRAWQLLRAVSEALLHLLRTRRRRRKEAADSIYRSRAYWLPSHVLPVEDDVQEAVYKTHDDLFYYDSTWNNSAFFPPADRAATVDGVDEAEGEDSHDGKPTEGAGDGEIDRLADVFIANFHEKFRLEKQESYRMFQEMLARGV